ncbi:hypothetical protein GCM10010104_66580 [Streptomyces indiaensis]|uniref:Uncharacterized protein n=1 Tax=Streptomyces indiaensis TaxID=284033 RepID=A0ABN3EIM3_9ACTN
MQDAAVREDGERHGLTRLGFALGERHLLELALGGRRFVVFRVPGVGAGDGGGGSDGEKQAGEQGYGAAKSGTPGGAGAAGSGSVHEVPPGTGWAVRGGCEACVRAPGCAVTPEVCCALSASRQVSVVNLWFSC